MANSKELFNELVCRITLSEPADEIRSIVYTILEHQLGVTQADVIAGKGVNNQSLSTLDAIVNRVNSEEPLQYILGEAFFYGRKFLVDPSVLIPRPETETIIDEVLLAYPRPGLRGWRVLDIGTGTGCIAITLALESPKAKVYATDTSIAALMTAVGNARQHATEIEFIRHNILTDSLPLQEIDAVVSNPPYIALSEKTSMKKNVVDFEPAEALFVPDENPLLFYSAIANGAKEVLRPGGKAFVEINERFGGEVQKLFLQAGFPVSTIVKDMAGKDRVVVSSL